MRSAAIQLGGSHNTLPGAVRAIAPIDPLNVPEIEVVHLVWKPAGIAPFREFLRSYREYPAEIDHDLVVLFNGFRGDDLAKHRAALAGIPHRELRVPYPVRDLKAYFWIAKRAEGRVICFLNSYSTLLTPGWLRKLHENLTRPGVAAAGATGSWESFYTNYLLRMEEVGQPRTLAGWVKHLNRLRKLHRYKANFRPAPNPHLRSNAFMIERARWLALMPGSLRTKWSTWLFESGKRGLTPQLTARGLEVVVVGRDGRGYRQDEWQESGTYRRADQANLLVADNRTRQYAEAGEDARRYMSRIAWGE